MDPDVALSDLASWATRRIRAKLFRRFHRLCCGCLHTHNLPGSVIIFKLFPLFHQLVGLYPLRMRCHFYASFAPFEVQNSYSFCQVRRYRQSNRRWRRALGRLEETLSRISRKDMSSGLVGAVTPLEDDPRLLA